MLARYAVADALALLLVGIALTWWAPAVPAKPADYVRVEHVRGSTCGTLQSADGGRIRLAVPGRHQVATVALTDVTNIFFVGSPPPGTE